MSGVLGIKTQTNKMPKTQTNKIEEAAPPSDAKEIAGEEELLTD